MRHARIGILITYVTACGVAGLTGALPVLLPTAVGALLLVPSVWADVEAENQATRAEVRAHHERLREAREGRGADVWHIAGGQVTAVPLTAPEADDIELVAA